VNEPGLDVFTANTRSVLYMKHSCTGLSVAFVAIGALLVGSIGWTNGGQKGNMVKRGEELG
jgi:phosphatidylserine decarboxylase